MFQREVAERSLPRRAARPLAGLPCSRSGGRARNCFSRCRRRVHAAAQGDVGCGPAGAAADASNYRSRRSRRHRRRIRPAAKNAAFEPEEDVVGSFTRPRVSRHRSDIPRREIPVEAFREALRGFLRDNARKVKRGPSQPRSRRADRRMGRRSFEVLHLLAQLVDHRLQLHADHGQPPVERLGAERVCLPVKFLRQEIKPAAWRDRRN